MKNYLFKLHFITALHIGNDSGRDNLASSETSIHSDTIFSALCTEAARYGQDILAKFVEMTETGDLVLSDALPFREDEYFLPKPAYRKQITHPLSNPGDRKLFKKLDLIPISMFSGYLQASDDFPFDIRRAVSLQRDLVFPEKRQRASVIGKDETEPYFVGSIVFNDDCGLYLLAELAGEEALPLLQKLLVSLSYSGIGGKRSSGFGKFSMEGPVILERSEKQSEKLLEEYLTNQTASAYMTINTSLPGDEEMKEALKGGYFTLCRRGGFVESPEYSKTPMKKRTVYALAPGAWVHQPYKGTFCNLAEGGHHPIYRCLKPLFLGVAS